jgi:hypothetical protein
MVEVEKDLLDEKSLAEIVVAAVNSKVVSPEAGADALSRTNYMLVYLGGKYTYTERTKGA